MVKYYFIKYIDISIVANELLKVNGSILICRK